MKQLKTVVKEKLQNEKTIWINKKSQEKTDEWYKFEDFTKEELFKHYTGKEKVIKSWYEEGLCIILDM